MGRRADGEARPSADDIRRWRDQLFPHFNGWLTDGTSGLAESMTQRERRRDAQAAMAELLCWVERGVPVAEARKKVGRGAYGRSEETIRRWRRENPQFDSALKKLVARNNQPDLTLPGEPKKRDVGDFAEFRWKFFQHETPAHQQRLVQILEEAKPMSITLVLMPPEAGKTTTLEDYCTYRICKDPNVRIVYGRTKGKLAAQTVMRVKNRLDPESTPCPDLLVQYGPFYEKGQERQGKIWTNSEFRVVQSDHDEREPTMMAAGVLDNIRGFRADLMIIDDPQTQKTLGQTQQIVANLRSDWFSRVGNHAAIVIVTNRIGVGDFVDELMNPSDGTESPFTEIIEMPAITIDPETGEEVSYWPERHPIETLRIRRDRFCSAAAWAANYQQAPKDAKDRTFTDDMIANAWNPAVTAGQMMPSADAHWLSFDPALGGRSALLAVAATGEGVTVLDCVMRKGQTRTEQWLQDIELLAARYQPSVVVIEQSTMAGGFARDDRLRALSSKYGFMVREHVTSHAKADPHLGVAQMSTGFVRGEVRFAEAGDGRRRLQELISDLERWRPDERRASGSIRKVQQDGTMALWFAWRMWKESRPIVEFKDDWWNMPRTVPWAAGGRDITRLRDGWVA